MSFTFSYEPNIFVSGVFPQIVQTGHSFEITGSGVCSATGVTLTDGCGGCRHNIPFVTGYGKNTDYCVLTGTLPDISPEAFMTLEVADTRSTGTFYPFEIMGDGPCILNCEEVIITGNLTVTGDVNVTGDVTYLNPPINNILTGFLAVDGNGKIFQRQIDPTGTTGQYNPGGVLMIAGSGLRGGGDVTLTRRFDVGFGSGTLVSDDGVSIGCGSGVIVNSGDISIGQGSGILVRTDGTVAVDSGQFLHTGASFLDVHASVGLTGNFLIPGTLDRNLQSGRVFLGETLQLGVVVDYDTMGFTGASGDDLAAFTVKDGGITPAKVSFGFAGSNIKSGAANYVSGYLSGNHTLNNVIFSGGKKQGIGVFSVPGIISGGAGLAPLYWSGSNDTEIQVSGLLINVGLHKGLTGDSSVVFGDTLDIGVQTDDVTLTSDSPLKIKAGGVSNTEIDFAYAGSASKSGAANFTSGYITGGLGLESNFVWSGDSKVTLDLDPTGHPHLRNLVYTTGNQTISGFKTFSGQLNVSGLEVFGLLTATGDGIFVSDLRITGDVSGAMTMKSLNISGINFTDRYATTEIMPANPTQSDGIEIFSMNYTAQATGNYLILDTELNLGAKEMADSVICIFRDNETSPIRAWTQNINNNNQGLVFNMKYFHEAEDTALHTYKIRVGRRETRGYDPIVYINRLWSYPNEDTYPHATGYLGDAAVSSFLISEIKPHPTGSRW